jgi:uncharacterized membrane-anchored protein
LLIFDISSVRFLKVRIMRPFLSKSTITRLPGFQVVTGEEARRFRELADGYKVSSVEAEAFDPNTGSEIIYEWFPVGYVTSDDWSNVDPNDMLAQMQRNDTKANEERTKHGVPTLTTTGWRQTPRLNSYSHTVSWIVEGKSSDGSQVTNSVALKLGRYGYEKIIWISDAKNASGRNDLLLAEDGFEFGQGARYDNYLLG